ncbi:MAG: transcriptional regulator, ArsR family [Blastococcus sp.]|nr:transcriptional regulator, ArsR family [Blastococcus sp.]
MVTVDDERLDAVFGVLERYGSVGRGRHRQTRPCRLEPQALEAAVGCSEESRRVRAERTDRLARQLARLTQGDPP